MFRSARFYAHLLLLLLLCGSNVTVRAQQYYGGITGTIFDPSGAVVLEAVVTVTSLDKQTSAQASSNAHGIYRLLNLDPGAYSLTVEAPGFRTHSVESVLVETGRVLAVDATLLVGSPTEVVNVEGAPPILETESGASTATLEGDMVANLPTYVRARADIKTYIQQLPNSNYGGDGRLMVNGSRSSQVQWDADGISNKNATRGGMMQEHSLNVESIREFKYVLTNAGAESATPARVTLHSKSGSNTFHGAVYWDTHHSAFDARSHASPEGSQKPFERHNWIGINASGPVFIPKIYDGRNKTFFMVTEEVWKQPTNIFRYITTPTEQMRNGDFSRLLDPKGDLIRITDPRTGEAFANNQIPESRLYEGSRNYLDAYYPTDNVSTDVFADNAFVHYRQYSLESRRTDVRVDQTVTNNNRMFVRWNKYVNPDSMYYRFLGSGRNTNQTTNGSFQISDTHVFTPTLLNEFRIGKSLNRYRQRVGVTARDAVNLLGLSGMPPELVADGLTGLPNINITGVTGVTQFSHTEVEQNLWDIHEIATYQAGKHKINFGVNFRRDYYVSNNWDKPGTFQFTGNFTGFGVSDFLLGLPFEAVRSYPRALLGPVEQSAWYSGWFIQHDYKVRPNLTLNLGLRWDVTFPGEEKNGLYYSFDPESATLVVPSQQAIDRVVPTFPSSATFMTAGALGYPERLRSTDKNNLAPRIGLAWRPFGNNTVIRSAYGIYYDSLSLGYMPTSGPWGGSETFRNKIEANNPLWAFPNAYPDDVAGNRPSAANISGFDRDLIHPYVQQWNMTIERQIAETAFRIQYVGTKSTNLYWQRDINVPAPSTIPFQDSRRPYPEFRSIDYRINGGNSTYHGLTLGAERRQRNGITFNSFFTWARMLTDSYEQNENSNLAIGRWYPTFDRAKWRGNETHLPKFRWTSTFLVELPFGHGKRFGSGWSGPLNHVLGGWAISGLLNVETGWWVSPYYSGGTDPASIQWNQGVPDRIGDGGFTNKNLQPGDRFLNAAAFVMPPDNVGRFGTSGTNFLQEPSFWDFNLAARKTFSIYERLRFELLGKFENLLNHGYWGHSIFNGSLNLSNPATFGVVTGGQAGNFGTGNRRIAFLLRMAW